MKNIKELMEVHDSERAEIYREGVTRILVGMATCGIAAGAAPVKKALDDELARRDIANVRVIKTGCIGICQYEPVMEVIRPGEEKVTYVHMSPDKVHRVVADHIIGGYPVNAYTIGAAHK